MTGNPFHDFYFYIFWTLLAANWILLRGWKQSTKRWSVACKMANAVADESIKTARIAIARAEKAEELLREELRKEATHE